MKPMMWMGRVSGFAAFAMGALFAAFAALQLSWGIAGIQTILAMFGSALLLTGSWRTLRRESGGLRLLCGAWGFAAGMLLSHFSEGSAEPNANSYSLDPVTGWVVLALPFIALAGFALTVLHKEK